MPEVMVPSSSWQLMPQHCQRSAEVVTAKLLPVMFYVAVITLLLITVSVMVSMNLSINWIFWVTFVGQVLIVMMVYRTLTDNYKTDKTFNDFYEDHPIGNQ